MMIIVSIIIIIIILSSLFQDNVVHVLFIKAIKNTMIVHQEALWNVAKMHIEASYLLA